MPQSTLRQRILLVGQIGLVRELVIAHAKPGLHKVYDQHAYQDEKRECLELWEKRLLAMWLRARIKPMNKSEFRGAARPGSASGSMRSAELDSVS